MSHEASSCERARAWAALEPDGTLSAIEAALLSAHLEKCARCRAFADTVTQLTHELRAAPLEAWDGPPLTAPARRRRIPSVVPRLAAAASLLVVVGGIVAQVQVSGREEPELAGAALVEQRGAEALEKRVAQAARVRSGTISAVAATADGTPRIAQFPEQLYSAHPAHLSSVRQP